MLKSLLNTLSVLIAISFFSPSAVHAQTPKCSSSAGAVSKMWDQYGKWAPAIPYGEWLTATDKAIRGWNSVVNNSWATIGPRDLDLPSATEKGTILGQTNRTFVTPPAYHNTVTITLKKTDGKAKTGVTICTTTENGSAKTVHSYTFNNGNYTRTKKFTINNAKGKVISVNMRNYSVTNKFMYTISSSSK